MGSMLVGGSVCLAGWQTDTKEEPLGMDESGRTTTHGYRVLCRAFPLLEGGGG